MAPQIPNKEEWNSDGTVTVVRQSPISGTVNSRVMRFTKQAYHNWADNNMLIQDALPGLSPDDREFLMTGITPAEWAATFPPEDDE